MRASPVAWMRVRWPHGDVDVLFVEGATRGGDGRVMWMDWRASPLGAALLDGRRAIELVTRGVRVRGEILARSFFETAASITLPARTALERKTRPLRLDPVQSRAVQLDEGRSLLVVGGAGHGKTTLAVHRLARLRGARALVLTPTEGLRASIERMLVRLGVTATVATVRAWARARARKAFVDFPKRRSETPAHVRALKRDASLAPLLEAIAAQPARRIDDDEDAPDVRSDAHARRADLQHLFGDRARMASIASPEIADATIAHTRAQFSLRTERAMRHLDRARLVAIDGRRLDDGTPDADAASADDEDALVLFEIDRLRAVARGLPPTRIPTHDVIFLDEAQELAPIELRLIARALAPGGRWIVAGDAAQRLDRDAPHDWTAVLDLLGADAERVELPRSHRARPSLTRVLDALRDGGAPTIPVASVASELAAARVIARTVTRIRRHDPRARTMVILVDEGRAVRLERVLGAGVATIVTIEHARGLEADYVLIGDAERFGADARARRTLHFAIARARIAAAAVAIGDASALIRPARGPAATTRR